jgi:hypothetical protein
MVIGKRGPKSEKEVFISTAESMIRSFMPELTAEKIRAMAIEKWDAHERAKVKISGGKDLSGIGKTAEDCVLLSKAFGGMDTALTRDGKANRDLNRIAETFGNVRVNDGETFAGKLKVSQGALWFNPDAPLRKICDLAYSLTTNPRINLREGSERKIVERFTNSLRSAMSSDLDGIKAQKRILPALYAALEMFADTLADCPDVLDSEESDDLMDDQIEE